MKTCSFVYKIYTNMKALSILYTIGLKNSFFFGLVSYMDNITFRLLLLMLKIFWNFFPNTSV